MPLKLIPPEKTPGGRNYAIHGSHLGVGVRRSAKTDRREIAKAELKRLEREIECGRHAEAAAPAPKSFADAALGYLKACPTAEVARVERLLVWFKDEPLSGFNKDKIDAGEMHFYPSGLSTFKGSTLNREYRTPLAAILHNAARRELMSWVEVEKYREEKRTTWHEPEAAIALIAAAKAGDDKKAEHHQGRLAPLLIVLFSTGMRISEACGVAWAHVNLGRREIRLEDTKNGESYTVHLGDLAFEAIANLPGPRHPERKIFGYTSRHGPRSAIESACEAAGLVECDKDGEVVRHLFSFHQARHSFATWLRRNGEDMRKIMDLGRWKSAQSVMRYQHVAADEHAPAIAALPINPKKPKKKESA